MIRPWQRRLQHPAVLTAVIVAAAFLTVWYEDMARRAYWDAATLRAAGLGFLVVAVAIPAVSLIQRPEQAARWLAGLEEVPTATRWLGGLLIAALVFVPMYLLAREAKGAYFIGAYVALLLSLPLQVWVWDRAEEMRRNAKARGDG